MEADVTNATKEAPPRAYPTAARDRRRTLARAPRPGQPAGPTDLEGHTDGGRLLARRGGGALPRGRLWTLDAPAVGAVVGHRSVRAKHPHERPGAGLGRPRDIRGGLRFGNPVGDTAELAACLLLKPPSPEANFGERRQGEVRRIPFPRTPVNKLHAAY